MRQSICHAAMELGLWNQALVHPPTDGGLAAVAAGGSHVEKPEETKPFIWTLNAIPSPHPALASHTKV